MQGGLCGLLLGRHDAVFISLVDGEVSYWRCDGDGGWLTRCW